MEGFPIDAVVAWVDGNDPVHRAKRMKYASPDQIGNDEVGGDIRFTSIGEIRYCVASLLRFAPFLRKIFIVTDAQNPDLDDFLDRNFPGRTTAVEIVDHKVLFRGHEELLPVFNSLSIETVLWRIPGLSEHFIYLNDDFMVVSPTAPSDYFDGDRAVCYAEYFSVPFAAFLRAVKPKRNGFRIFGFKDAMLNAARVVGERRRFPYIGHIPLAQKKSVLEHFYTSHPDILVENMSPRFREPWQHNPQVLFYLLALRDGNAVMRPRRGKDLYVKPKQKPGYMERKLKGFDRAHDALFACFNSLDYASEQDRKLALDWLSERLSLDMKGVE